MAKRQRQRQKQVVALAIDRKMLEKRFVKIHAFIGFKTTNETGTKRFMTRLT